MGDLAVHAGLNGLRCGCEVSVCDGLVIWVCLTSYCMKAGISSSYALSVNYRNGWMKYI